MNIQEVLREMRELIFDCDPDDIERWTNAIEAAMREPVAWRYRLNGSPVVSIYPPIRPKEWEPLFAFPPDAAGEIKKITEAHEDALLDVRTALNEAKGDAEDWHDSYDSIVEEFRMRGAEIERLKALWYADVDPIETEYAEDYRSRAALTVKEGK